MFRPGRPDPPFLRGVGGSFSGTGANERLTMESELEDGWRVTGTLVFREGRVRVRSVTFVPGPHGDDTVFSLRMLRRMNLGWVQRQWEGVLRGSMYVDLPDKWQRGMLASPRAGRRGHPDAFYAQWVARYLEACEASETPVRALVKQWGEKGETTASINRYVKRAEVLGLITERPGRGRAGGTMTEKCKELLEGEET